MKLNTTRSSCRPFCLLVICHMFIMFINMLMGLGLFLSLACLIDSLILLWMLWTCTWNIQQRWSLIVYILCILHFTDVISSSRSVNCLLILLHFWWWTVIPLDNQHVYTLNVFSWQYIHKCMVFPLAVDHYWLTFLRSWTSLAHPFKMALPPVSDTLKRAVGENWIQNGWIELLLVE